MKNSIPFPGISNLAVLMLCASMYTPCAGQHDNQLMDFTTSIESNRQVTIPFMPREPYFLKLALEKTADGHHQLVIKIELYNGSHYVSPYSNDSFSGRFTVYVPETSLIELDGAMTEDPRSVEEFDPHPFVNGPVNWVRQNTTYQYGLEVMTAEDFDVAGFVRFTIEPRCTLEEFTFQISQRDGVLYFKKLPSGC